MTVSESIVSDILIKKTKKIFSFSQKNVAKNRKFLRGNLKAKAKFKKYEKPGVLRKTFKKKIFFFCFLFLFFYLFYFYFFDFQPKSFFWLEKSNPLKKFTPPPILGLPP